MNHNWPRYFYLRTEEHRYEEIAGYCIDTKPCEGCDICQEEYGYQRRFYQPNSLYHGPVYQIYPMNPAWRNREVHLGIHRQVVTVNSPKEYTLFLLKYSNYRQIPFPS